MNVLELMANVLEARIFIVSVLLMASAGAETINRAKSSVVVYNEVDDFGHLWLHCRSKDDDLGWRKIMPSNKFEFTFSESIWENTVFYCTFVWHEGHNWQVHTVWSSDGTRKHDMPVRCNDCDWRARSTGTFLYDDSKKEYIFAHEWYTNGTWLFPPETASQNGKTPIALPKEDHLD